MAKVFIGTGRRKSSVAQVKMTAGKGNITVNDEIIKKPEYKIDENIDFCYYPSPEDSESYFVIFGIPANCFFPKPSKSIVH